MQPVLQFVSVQHKVQCIWWLHQSLYQWATNINNISFNSKIEICDFLTIFAKRYLVY